MKSEGRRDVGETEQDERGSGRANMGDITLLEAEDIYKSYVVRRKRLDVLQGVSLVVQSGDAVAVMGPSGAGKSTLLHILGGLDRPDAGRVIILGQDFYALSERARALTRARRIGFVFQNYHLLPEMDVMENVMLPAMARGGWQSRRALRRRAAELLEAVGLSERASHTPQELSGGEQQRVALARALVNDPEIVLADEPTGNLDDETGAQVLDYLFALTTRRRHTLIVVTHNEKVARACHRVLRLERG
ncbi:MAG: ABC transporter ATP-binding protein, partial [Kiritimatiellae bacterium]|nr:ABC transporter ATP-binding protein [Kiritimatiellia bacterium]